MSKEAIKNLLMDFMADYDPNKWSNDDVYEKYAEKIDNVRSMGEIIAFTELTKKVKDLEHRLSNCIEPKFKVGQEVWFVVCDGVKKDVIENNWFLCSLEKSRLGLYEDYLYATEEEAKAKLEELNNG